jgi:hypothetical protein
MTMHNQRSPLTLSALQVLMAVLVFILTQLGLHYGLESVIPYFTDVVERGDPWAVDWMVNKRQEIYSAFALPLGVGLLIPAVSLVRGIRGDVRHFSRLGHFALAWPLVMSVLLWHQLLMFFICPFLLLSLIVAFLASSRSLLFRYNWGDLLAIPLNIGWVILCWSYYDRWIAAFIW